VAGVTGRATGRSYDRVAERYAREIGDELRHKPLDRALLGALAELTGGAPLVDVGCGPGHVTAHLARLGAAAIGLDLSVAMAAGGHRRSGLPFAAADMTGLPVRSGALGGVACLYAVIHLDGPGRSAAYAELARVLRPGGHALVAFHVRDADVAAGGRRTMTSWWGHDVDLTFWFLDPDGEVRRLAAAGFDLVARTDRAPEPDGSEHPSERTYLLVRRRA
jgi:SAM-dependent methyltransferase